MASATVALQPSSLRSWIKRLLILFSSLLVLGVLILAAASAWFVHTAKGSLPQLDGSLQLSGLHQSVTIRRDAHGVPHITAANMQDLMFAQGFVTAQDRLWQMDLSRRFGRGELSELRFFGTKTLLIDIRQRTLQLRQVAEKAAAALPEEERAMLQAYANGVNALIARQQNNLPIEFRVQGYSPRPWTIEDSLMVGINISQSLNTQYDVEIRREKVLAAMPAALGADLYPNGSWRDRSPVDATTPERNQRHAPIPQPEPALQTSSLLQWFGEPSPADICDTCTPGSNNWVVSGSRTRSGKPLLANDMHLQHAIPNVWYEVHLAAGEYDVAGVSFPGLPFVVSGHNRRIAWGFTNVGPDVQDLFIEEFNTSGEYRTPAGFVKPAHHKEVIHVEGSQDVTLDVLVTRHGPVVSKLFPGEHRHLALQWTLYQPQALSLAFHKMGLAHDWPSFRTALSTFGGAAQNVVYADVDGNIGYQLAGTIPIRAAGDGLSPVPGATDEFAWTGAIPFAQLPTTFNPPSGVIATANARVTPAGYPHPIANQWSAPYRTERIYKVLESRKDLTAQDMLALQMDVYSEFDRLVADKLVYAVDHSPKASTRARQAADLMRGWDGKVTVRSAAPTLALHARRQLWKLLLQPHLGLDRSDYSWFGSSIALEKMLTTRPQRWLPKGHADFDALLAAAVEEAVALKVAPRDLSAWTWGKASPVEIQHPIFGQVPLLNRSAGPGSHPQSGSGSLTVKAAGRSFGASERFTADMADLDQSTLNIVVGQSGQIFSPHYMDHWDAWYNGKPLNLPFSEEKVKAATRHTLTLQPVE